MHDTAWLNDVPDDQLKFLLDAATAIMQHGHRGLDQHRACEDLRGEIATRAGEPTPESAIDRCIGEWLKGKKRVNRKRQSNLPSISLLVKPSDQSV